MNTHTVNAMPSLSPRHLIVVTVVVAAHAGVLWLLQANRQSRAPQEVLIPAQIEVEWLAPAPTVPPQRVVPPSPPRPAPSPPVPRPTAPPVSQAAPAPEPTPVQPVTEPAPTTTASSPAAVVTVVPSLPPSITVDTPSVTSALQAPPAPPRIELPSAAARYLNNPPPRYPPLSRRLGEQGQVLLRVRIEVDGTASQAEIRSSSGYTRLDQAALQTVLTWRYVPGNRNGVPEAMWFNIPINFVLE